MKKISIVGTGMGTAGSLTIDGIEAIESASLLIGSERLLRPWQDGGSGRQCAVSTRTEEIVTLIRESEAEKTAVLMSGDTGFYSGARGLLEKLTQAAEEDWEIFLLPGVSSLSYLAARTGVSWEDAKLVSLHGRKANLCRLVAENRKVFVLTAKNAGQICRELTAHGLGSCHVWIGENLSYPEEWLAYDRVEAFQELEEGDALSALLFLNERPRRLPAFGLPDEMFLRGSVPMTKAEVRSLIGSMLAPGPEEVLYDIGAGTGSVTIEMARAAQEGRVVAVERESGAVELIRANCDRFGLTNVEVVQGEAPEVLSEELPMPNAAFIGGSGGELAGIVERLRERNGLVRICISAVTVETASEALRILEGQGMEPEAIQLSVSRSKRAGNRHLLMAQNPIWLIRGQIREPGSLEEGSAGPWGGKL